MFKLYKPAPSGDERFKYEVEEWFVYDNGTQRFSEIVYKTDDLAEAVSFADAKNSEEK